MAQSNPNLERDLRAMRRDHIREEEDRERAERTWRETETARRREEEYRRQVEADERRRALEEDEERLAEEERQMRFFEQERRKRAENQLLQLQRQRKALSEYRRGIHPTDFGEGRIDLETMIPANDRESQSGKESLATGRNTQSELQYESFGLDTTQVGDPNDVDTVRKEVVGSLSPSKQKRRVSFQTPERRGSEDEDFIRILSTEIKELDKRLVAYGRGLTQKAKDTRTAYERHIAPRQLFTEESSEERHSLPKVSERESDKKSVASSQGATQNTEREERNYYPAQEQYRISERDTAEQDEKLMLLRKREEDLRQREEQIRKLEREQAAQREMTVMFQRREKEFREKEEKLWKLERYLNERERFLEHQNHSKNPYEDELQDRDRQIDIRLAEMNRRQKLIEEREAALDRAKTEAIIQSEVKNEKSEEIPQRVLEEDILCVKHMATSTDNKEEAEYRRDAATNTEKYQEAQNQDKFPRFSPFSGEDPQPKTEASYEEWKYEVNCIWRAGRYSEEAVAQAIRKSVRGQAKRVLLTMGITDDVKSVLQRLETVFGNVSTGESILEEFYTAFQKQDESVNNWGLRLEEILQQAIDKGHVKEEEKDERLREKFWRSLRSEKLKNASRLQFETIKSFEMLRSAVRAEEKEMKRTAAAQYQPVKVQYKEENTDISKEDSKLDTIMHKLAEMDSEIKELKSQQQSRRPWYDRRRPNYPDEHQQKQTSEDSSSGQAKNEQKKSGN